MTTSAATSLSREVTAFCVHCGHGAVLDLKALLEAGDGDTELITLPLPCSACGKKDHRITISGGNAGIIDARTRRGQSPPLPNATRSKAGTAAGRAPNVKPLCSATTAFTSIEQLLIRHKPFGICPPYERMTSPGVPTTPVGQMEGPGDMGQCPPTGQGHVHPLSAGHSWDSKPAYLR
jgi:hypothetical protein